MKDDKVYERNYMGIMSWSRTSCNPAKTMFGTEVKTNNPVSLTISTAEEERSLSSNSYYGKKKIIEVEMTPIQWAEFLTSGNTSGVPVTLVKVNNEFMDKVENNDVIDQFSSETKVAFDAFEESLSELKSTIGKKLDQGKTLTKTELKEMMRSIDIYRKNCRSNVNFVKDCFTEEMTSIVVKARAEISAYCETETRKYGLASIKEKNLTLEDKEK